MHPIGYSIRLGTASALPHNAEAVLRTSSCQALASVQTAGLLYCSPTQKIQVQYSTVYDRDAGTVCTVQYKQLYSADHLSGVITNADREILIFPVQLTTSRTGNLARLIHTLLYTVKNGVTPQSKQTPRGAKIEKKSQQTEKTPLGVLFRAFSRRRPRGAGQRHEKVCEKDLLPKRKGTLRNMQRAE